MTSKQRREVLRRAGALAAGGVAAYAMPAHAAGEARLPFNVAPTLIPIAGGEVFAVRRIYCIGRNYAAHARGMGSDPTREPPFSDPGRDLA
jgi:2-keto-4-pentenoate hydratase/2-oxohepta-3-ene-1,7-dioic acid hydratase in catechol pathway